MVINSKNIKALMNEQLMIQSELAERAGVSRVTINTALLRGSCSRNTVRRIAKALNVDVEEIIEKEGEWM